MLSQSFSPTSVRSRGVLGALLPALLLAGCSNSDSSNPPASDTTAPTFSVQPVLTPNSNASVPLAARIAFATDEPARVELTIDDGVSTWTVTPDPAFQIAHDVAVLGVQADRTHLITVGVEDAAGNASTFGPLAFQTPPLPDPFPPIQVATSDPTRMEPGVTLFNARISDPAIPGTTWGMLVMLNEAGEPIWFYQANHQIDDARRLANGHILYNYNSRGVVEIDVFGDVQGHWWSAGLATPTLPAGALAVQTDSFHHEVLAMPPGSAGDFAALSSELRGITNYPASEADPTILAPGTTNVIGDVIVEFKRDGTIVDEWKLFDLLDPFRISYGSLGSFWDQQYGVPTADWTHANALVYDAADDAWIVSVRHQEAVVKIDRQTSAIEWILGPPEAWIQPWANSLLDPGADDPVLLAQGALPFEWNYHQHAPALLSDGDILMFDNGNGRAVPPDPELSNLARYSRAVRYEIDTAANTASQVWSYGSAADLWYSGFLGDADLMPTTSNVLIADGGKNDGVQLTGRVLEVTGDVVPDVVFEFELREVPANLRGWTIYRAERLAGVYP